MRTMNRIVVLSDEINSGKTTAILKWKEQVSNVFGVLSPKDIGGRIFEDAKTGEKWPMEAREQESAFEVGRYKFSRLAFEKAIDSISKGLNQSGLRFVVFDEIGPLEMRNSGFHSILSESLAIILKDPELQLLVVVRKSMLIEFIDKYQISDCKVISVIDFLRGLPPHQINIS